MDKNSELELIQQLANQLSLSRVKTEGLLFDKDYRRDTTTGQLQLVTEKAVVTTHGKTSKVLFGPNEKYKTYEEAVEQTKLYWSLYFKQRRDKARATKSPVAKAGERRRQKTYRDKRNQERDEFERRQ